MTIKELKAAIADLPDDMEVLLESNPEEGLYSLSGSVTTKRITPQDNETDEVMLEQEYCIISDEL